MLPCTTVRQVYRDDVNSIRHNPILRCVRQLSQRYEDRQTGLWLKWNTHKKYVSAFDNIWQSPPSSKTSENTLRERRSKQAKQSVFKTEGESVTKTVKLFNMARK